MREGLAVPTRRTLASGILPSARSMAAALPASCLRLPPTPAPGYSQPLFVNAEGPIIQPHEDAQPVGGRAQPPVNFDCQSWHTTSVEHATSKSAGGEHVPPAGEFGELTPPAGGLGECTPPPAVFAS